jgi:hypothetical protein
VRVSPLSMMYDAEGPARGRAGQMPWHRLLLSARSEDQNTQPSTQSTGQEVSSAVHLRNRAGYGEFGHLGYSPGSEAGVVTTTTVAGPWDTRPCGGWKHGHRVSLQPCRRASQI